MSADHRKPVVAFVMLALAAAVVVGIQQAEAQGARYLAGAIGADARVQGSVPVASATLEGRDFRQIQALGPAFTSLQDAVGHAGAEDVVEPLALVVGTPVPAPPEVAETPQRRAASAETSTAAASKKPSRSDRARSRTAKKAEQPVHKPAGQSARPGGSKRSAVQGDKVSGAAQRSFLPAQRFAARSSHGLSSRTSVSAPATSTAWADGRPGKASKAAAGRSGKASKRIGKPSGKASKKAVKRSGKQAKWRHGRPGRR